MVLSPRGGDGKSRAQSAAKPCVAVGVRGRHPTNVSDVHLPHWRPSSASHHAQRGEPFVSIHCALKVAQRVSR
jgi:hypothetical protein